MDEFEECHCNHNCGFEGPEICGSDGNTYLNACRMAAASCELNREITEQDRSICFQGKSYSKSIKRSMNVTISCLTVKSIFTFLTLNNLNSRRGYGWSLKLISPLLSGYTVMDFSSKLRLRPTLSL